jgi:predicted dehydrogenase
MQKMKTAIFGTGFMGRVHTEALRRLGNIEILSVAGSTLDRAKRFADVFGIRQRDWGLSRDSVRS